ncbi:MAG: hypothetical protein EXS24_07260 [Pedosphaera sp.]|nr:hypothetical protein [Pedosphaera sp.]
MHHETPNAVDRLWNEYRELFSGWDELTLARWLSQTLSQLQGRSWRMSHPLVAAYRLAAQMAVKKHVWSQRLVAPPNPYLLAECCRSPLLPLVTRDAAESGFLCLHCNASCVTAETVATQSKPIADWANEYATHHAVAHWDDAERRRVRDYDKSYQRAASKAELLLAKLGLDLAPKLLDYYPAVIWEDQDECLQVLPEDVRTGVDR